MMRLPLEQHLRPVQRVLLGGFKMMFGDAPGPVVIASYKKGFLGNPWALCMKEGMRRSTEWSIGEVELFAAFVSRANSCAF
jgi:hypothetical protein